MKLRIVQDQDAQSPQEYGDDALFLVANHRDFYVPTEEQRKRQNKEGRRGPVDVQLEIDSHKKTHHVFLLEAYIHSGVVLALHKEGNFPDRQWDVSLLGAVFASKNEWRTRDAARKAVLGYIETWNQYLSGDVWGFIVEDDNGNHLDSCWGFYGHDYAKQQGEEALRYATEHSFDPAI
jgi:hypothetical protein